MKHAAIFPLLLGLLSPVAAAKEIVLDAKLHHLRAGDQPEWSDFPSKPEGPSLALRFQSGPNKTEWTLRVRQQDVRQPWKVMLNGKELVRLPNDENDQVLFFAIPAGRLLAGENMLTVEQIGKIPDDVRIGEIILDDRPVADVLSAATVEIDVTEAGQPVPCRLTILNGDGALMSCGAKSDDHLAVRPGVVYTSTGLARFGLPAGSYTVYAGRGFAYSLDSARIEVKPGDRLRKSLSIRRVVETPGWLCSDTHVHTLTHSGHGDCTIDERMITLAGEGIEVPIATDHNKQIDYEALAVKLGVRKYFTPIVGNEVTTAVGHFNIFPAPADRPLPDFKLKDWNAITANIQKTTAAKVVVLNHPRDLHSGFRPFGPERFISVSGERLDGMTLPANAMEVVNSGAHQTDFMLPFRDWFGLMNRGVFLTPVGASDSHDVSRYIVGQGRTYVRCESPQAAVAGFVQGRVMVSCGLLAEITVNGKYGPGALVPPSDTVKVHVRVLGPDWVKADKIELFANGRKIREAKIVAGDAKPGVKWQGEWTLPRFQHDVHLVAITSGPAVTELYWPISKPYQQTAPVVNRRNIGATGAVWIDADGDGQRTSAFSYAERLLKKHGPEKMIAALADYDEAVAIQAASLLKLRGVALDMDAARKAGEQVERGFAAFAEAWRASEIARQNEK